MASGRATGRETLTCALRAVRTKLEIRHERQADHFRATRTVTGSEHPGAVWSAPPPFNPRAGDAAEVSPVLEEVAA